MQEHFSNLSEHYYNGGVRGVFWWISKQYYRNIHPRIDRTNIYDRDWKLLVIIDGCHPSWLNQYTSDYDYLPKPSDRETIVSVGGNSAEWYQETFKSAPNVEIANTALISANPLASEHVPSEIGLYDDLSEWAWNDKLRTVPAHTVTDRAVECGRQTDYDRYLVHYR